ncbi:MAG TPA: NIPSNAP family containing protein, partial [Segetibacter sp.]
MIKLLFSQILSLVLLCLSYQQASAAPKAKSGYYYEIKVYHISNSTQEASIDSFLQYQYIPLLHGENINNIGIFKPIANDTAIDKKIYVFTPYKNLKQWESINREIVEKVNTATNSSYTNAYYKSPAFIRMETIFLRSFEKMPFAEAPKLTGSKADRVYELRSYESASEKIFRNKVEMFNKGGEVGIFSRLGFNAVFYAEVLFGAKMPNLMYMTSFE